MKLPSYCCGSSWPPSLFHLKNYNIQAMYRYMMLWFAVIISTHTVIVYSTILSCHSGKLIVTSSTTIPSYNACMSDFWVVSDGEFQRVSYCQLIPGRNSMRVNSSSLSAHYYMKSPLSELVLLQFHWEQ